MTSAWEPQRGSVISIRRSRARPSMRRPSVPPTRSTRAPLGSPLRPLGAYVSADGARRLCLDDLGQTTSRVPDGRLHPWFLAARMAPLTRHNFTYGPTIHVRTQIQHRGPARAEQEVVVGARIVDVYDRKDHWYGRRRAQRARRRGARRRRELPFRAGGFASAVGRAAPAVVGGAGLKARGRVVPALRDRLLRRPPRPRRSGRPTPSSSSATSSTKAPGAARRRGRARPRGARAHRRRRLPRPLRPVPHRRAPPGGPGSPVGVIWDDDGSRTTTPGCLADGEDPAVFAARRLAAYQAWWEHMPVRIPKPQEGADTIIYRTGRYGDLLDLVLLDGRQFRSDQACGDARMSLEPACAEASDPTRTMLGSAQEAWTADMFRVIDARRGPCSASRPCSPTCACPTVPSSTRTSGTVCAGPRAVAGDRRASGRQARHAHRRHPPLRCRAAAGGGDRLVHDVGLLDRQRAGCPPAGARRLHHDRRRRLRHRGYVRHPDAGRLDGRVPHRRGRGHAASPVATWRTFTLPAGASSAVTAT